MEFCGREPMDVLDKWDCMENPHKLGSESLRLAFHGASQHGQSAAVHNCRVPIGVGTLLVFSNYQMAHRVLRLHNTSATEASRDFVALFVLDPSAPAPPAGKECSGGATVVETDPVSCRDSNSSLSEPAGISGIIANRRRAEDAAKPAAVGAVEAVR